MRIRMQYSSRSGVALEGAFQVVLKRFRSRHGILTHVLVCAALLMAFSTRLSVGTVAHFLLRRLKINSRNTPILRRVLLKYI